jgi:CRP-like cAMP-binding protein
MDKHELDIPEDELKLFSRLVRVFYKGELLIKEGDPNSKALFLVRRGIVGIYRKVNNGEELISVIGAVNFVGEMEVILGGPRLATVKAYTGNVVVYQFDNPDMDTILQNKEWGSKLLSRLCVDLKFFSDKAVELENEKNMLRQKTAELQFQLQLLNDIQV